MSVIDIKHVREVNRRASESHANLWRLSKPKLTRTKRLIAKKPVKYKMELTFVGNICSYTTRQLFAESLNGLLFEVHTYSNFRFS